MSCDYFIDKNLDIYDVNDEMISYINLDSKKRYHLFISTLDEDEDGYHEEYEKYINQTLEPSMKPIVIYINNSFTKLSFENKYKKMVEDELHLFNKTVNDVSKIIKKEYRYDN